VVAAIEGGMSRNQAAKQFEVAISTASGWMRRAYETGSVAAGPMGGHKPKAISDEHSAWLSQRVKNYHFTCALARCQACRARLKDRLPLGVGFCACREAQLQRQILRGAVKPVGMRLRTRAWMPKSFSDLLASAKFASVGKAVISHYEELHAA
jgi:hypothetical protein